MNKCKVWKLFLSLILSFSLILSLPITLYAEENNETLVVNMDYVSIPTDYLASDYYIEYIIESGVKKAALYEYSTGLLVEEYEEKNLTSALTRANYGNMTIQLTKSFYPTSSEISGTKLRLVVELDIYRETIAGQRVDTILGYHKDDDKLELVESGCYSLESQTVTLQQQTTSYCDVQCSAVIATYRSAALSAGVTFNFLQGAGFELTGMFSENWTARLPYGPKSVRITVSS